MSKYDDIKAIVDSYENGQKKQMAQFIDEYGIPIWADLFEWIKENYSQSTSEIQDKYINIFNSFIKIKQTLPKKTIYIEVKGGTIQDVRYLETGDEPPYLIVDFDLLNCGTCPNCGAELILASNNHSVMLCQFCRIDWKADVHLPDIAAIEK